MKSNSSNFCSNKGVESLDKGVFNNPKAKQIIIDALSDLGFNESTILNAKQNLEQLLGTKRDELSRWSGYWERQGDEPSRWSGYWERQGDEPSRWSGYWSRHV